MEGGDFSDLVPGPSRLRRSHKRARHPIFHDRRGSASRLEERPLDCQMPAIDRARIGTVPLRLGGNSGDDQPIGSTGERDVKQPPMLLEVASLLGEDRFLERRAALILFGAE